MNDDSLHAGKVRAESDDDMNHTLMKIKSYLRFMSKQQNVIHVEYKRGHAVHGTNIHK